MSRLIIMGIFILILLNSCEESTTETVNPVVDYATYIGDIALPFSEMGESHTFSQQISDQKHLLISYIVNHTEQVSYKELFIDLKHQYEIDSYLDFGYNAKLNENHLSRFHRSKNYNAFSFRKREGNLESFWSVEAKNSLIYFKANEGKMINEVKEELINPNLIQISNLKKSQSIQLNSDFVIRFNRPTTKDNTYIAIDLESQTANVERFVFKQSNSTDEIRFKQSDIDMLNERIKSLSINSARIWVLDERLLNSLETLHKLSGNIYYTPIILKSVFGISVQLENID